MNWFMKFFGRGDKQLQVGSRVRMKGQVGTVTSGTLHIKFDEQPSWMSHRRNHPNDKSCSININTTELEIL